MSCIITLIQRCFQS